MRVFILLPQIFVLIALSCINTLAQSKYVDSLKLELRKQNNDTTRCKVLCALAESASDEEWPKYNDELYRITESKLKSRELTNHEIFLYKVYYVRALNNLGFLSSKKGELDKAEEIFRTCLKICVELNDSSGISSAYNNLAGKFRDAGKPNEAIIYLNKAIELQRQMGDKLRLSNSYNNIALIYYNLGDILNSIKFNELSLKIREELNDSEGIAFSMNNLAAVYQSQGLRLKAFEMYEKVLSLHKKNGNRNGIAFVLNNMGHWCTKNNKMDEAMNYFIECLKIRKELKNPEGIALSLNNIGFVHMEKKNYSEALKYYNECLLIYQSIGNKGGEATTLTNIAYLFLELKKYKEALISGIDAMKINKELGYPFNIKNNSEVLYKSHKALGSYKEALENYEVFIQMRDSLNKIENRKAGLKSQLKYEYEKKAAADSVKAAEERKVVDAQLKQEKTQRFALYGGLGLVGIFALFMVNRFRVTNKQKKLIEEQKEIVESQKHLVEEKQREVIDSIMYAKRIQTALITNEHYVKQHITRLKA